MAAKKLETDLQIGRKASFDSRHKQKIGNVEQQIQKQWKALGYKNHLSEIIGKWPGNESFEELSKMLTK